jgi:hypothetical protein
MENLSPVKIKNPDSLSLIMIAEKSTSFLVEVSYVDQEWHFNDYRKLYVGYTVVKLAAEPSHVSTRSREQDK